MIMTIQDNDRVVVFHGGCRDGFAAAWLAWLVWPNAQFLPARHRLTPPAGLNGRHVVIVDYSYPRDVLEHLKTETASLTVLDHHDTAERDLKGLSYCTFDQTKSGSRLMYDYLVDHGYGEVLRNVKGADLIADYTEDYDLWRKRLPDTAAINAAIRNEPFDFAAWTTLAARPLDQLIADGNIILRYRRQLMIEHRERLDGVMIGGIAGIACECTAWEIASDMADFILGDQTLVSRHRPLFIAFWSQVSGHPAKRYFSLRSRDGLAEPDSKSIHVGDLAKTMGGGGHPQSAGFTIMADNVILLDKSVDPNDLDHSKDLDTVIIWPLAGIAQTSER